LDSHELKALLDAVRDGHMSPAMAAERIQLQPYQDAGGFAKVDLHRRVRCGFPEVIFGQGKTAPQIEAILKTLLEHEQGGLVTRLDPQAAVHLLKVFPQGEHNALGRTFRVRSTADDGPKLGRVVIVTAGTSDLPVAEEARVTAEAWNCDVSLVADVGAASAASAVQKRRCARGRRGDGRGAAQRRRRAGRMPGHRRPDQHRLWRPFPGRRRAFGHAQ
jgi:NCAIR mutase (PurE)-related protein